MSLATWIEQSMPVSRAVLTPDILPIPANRHLGGHPLTTQFTFNPFPYLPPELIVSILSYAPASSIPHLYHTNTFFQIHIDIYKKQLFKIRLTRYPPQFLTAYTSIHGTDFDSIHTLPNSWDVLSTFENKADICLSVQKVLPGIGGYRFYRAFLRQWESRQGMFFNKDEWAEALVERCHVYEDCSRSEICDIIHLQMVYRNILSLLPWHSVLEPCHGGDMRIHWSYKTDLYRNMVDQIIGCGPEFIISLLSSADTTIPLLRQCMQVLKERGCRYCCFDDVMSQLLRRWDGGETIPTRWQEEESYFQVCASGRYFTETDVRVIPFKQRYV
jgi:hypothetical protein